MKISQRLSGLENFYQGLKVIWILTYTPDNLRRTSYVNSKNLARFLVADHLLHHRCLCAQITRFDDSQLTIYTTEQESISMILPFKRWHCSPYSCHVADSWTSPVRPDLESMVNYSSVHATSIMCNNWNNKRSHTSTRVPTCTHPARVSYRWHRSSQSNVDQQDVWQRKGSRPSYRDNLHITLDQLTHEDQRPAFCVRVQVFLMKLIKAFFVAVPLMDVSSCSSNASHALKYRNRVTFPRSLRGIMRFSGSPSLLPSPSVDPVHLSHSSFSEQILFFSYDIVLH